MFLKCHQKLEWFPSKLNRLSKEALLWTNSRVRSHERRNELKPVRDLISVEHLTLVFSQLFTCVQMKSYRSFRQKWNFISGDKTSCKHYPKWNFYTWPSKYWVVLKCGRNETLCKQNLFSRRFEISNRYEFISPLTWTYSSVCNF